MWTRTLSTTISTSPSSIDRIIPRPAGSADRRIRPPMLTAIWAITAPDHEAADVGEERHPAAALDHAERGQAVDQLEHEPEAEHDDRRDVDELVEEAEEDERRHPGAREEHEVRAQRRRDRPGRADRRDRRGRVDGDLREAGERAAEEIEAEEAEPAEAVLDVVPEDPQVEHVAEQVQPAAVQELAGHQRRGLVRQVVAAAPGGGQFGRDDAPLRDEGIERGLAAAGHQAELPGEDDEAGDDERSVTTGVRRVGLASRRGIIGRPGSGLLGRLRGRLGRAGRAWRCAGARRRSASGTATRMAWWTPSRDIQTSVDGSVVDARDDVHRAQVGPVRGAAREAVLGDVLAVDLGQGDDPRVRLVVRRRSRLRAWPGRPATTE